MGEQDLSNPSPPKSKNRDFFFFLMQLGSTGGGVPGNLERNLNFFSHRQCFSISDPWASEAGHSYRKNILFFFRQNKRIKFSLWPWSSSSCLAKEQYINNTKLYCKNNWLEKPRFWKISYHCASVTLFLKWKAEETRHAMTIAIDKLSLSYA